MFHVIIWGLDMRKISLCHLTVLDQAPPEALRIAAQCGYDFVDLRIKPVVPSDVDYPVYGDTAMRRELLAMIGATGVSIFDVELVKLNEKTTPDDYLPMMEAGARLGARRIKVGSGDAVFARAKDLFAELTVHAKQHDLVADFEFHPWGVVNNLNKAVQLAKASDGVGKVLVDALHLRRSGGHPSDLAGVDRNLFGYLHLCDAPLVAPASLDLIAHEARNDRNVPGAGELPLHALLDQFSADTPISLEVPMPGVSAKSRAKRAIDALRTLLAERNER